MEEEGNLHLAVVNSVVLGRGRPCAPGLELGEEDLDEERSRIIRRRGGRRRNFRSGKGHPR